LYGGLGYQIVLGIYWHECAGTTLAAKDRAGGRAVSPDFLNCPLTADDGHVSRFTGFGY
jgi:hypothetical protein